MFQIDPVAAGLTGLCALVWLVRLEGRVNLQAKMIDLLQGNLKAIGDNHSALELKMVEQLGEIRGMLARIEERLNGRQIP